MKVIAFISGLTGIILMGVAIKEFFTGVNTHDVYLLVLSIISWNIGKTTLSCGAKLAEEA